MKNLFFIFSFLLFTFQNTIGQNDVYQILVDQDANVQQITDFIPGNIINFQSLNTDVQNLSWAKQSGNYNHANINQQNDQEVVKTNQAFTLQQGDNNEITIDQTGRGNLFISMQLGYLTFDAGNRNLINAIQQGEDNGLLAAQIGDDNSISAGQKGINNYLMIFQQGYGNTVTNLSQENASGCILYDKIIQNGDHLSLMTSDASRSTANQNTYVQSGYNLSLTIENEFINSMGGIEVNQTGHDMKIVVNQTYFPAPAN